MTKHFVAIAFIFVAGIGVFKLETYSNCKQIQRLQKESIQAYERVEARECSKLPDDHEAIDCVNETMINVEQMTKFNNQVLTQEGCD